MREVEPAALRQVEVEPSDELEVWKHPGRNEPAISELDLRHEEITLVCPSFLVHAHGEVPLLDLLHVLRRKMCLEFREHISVHLDRLHTITPVTRVTADRTIAPITTIPL